MSSVVPGVRHPIALLRVCLGVAMFWASAQETALLPAGATYTAGPLGGGGAVTVIAAVPLFPPLVAVIVANPAAPPVTSPVALTEARLGALLAQVTTRPLSGLPRESCGVAVSRTVAPTKIPASAGVTVTVATDTFVTVMADVPFIPSLVAVIVADPAAPPVTSPVPLTEARLGALLAQVTTRPLSGLPRESFGVAVTCNAAPTKMPATAGVIVTVATGTFVTEMADVPFFPSLVAVIMAEPAATPVTNPLVLTVATAVLLTHVTVRPVRGVPFESFGVAVNSVVAPSVTLAVVGLTVTDATGTLVTVTAAVPASVPPLWVAITR